MRSYPIYSEIGVMLVLYVIKRDGRIDEFHREKISNAIMGAANEIAVNFEEDILSDTVEKAVSHIEGIGKNKITVEEIQNCVERALKESKRFQVSVSYSNYSQE